MKIFVDREQKVYTECNLRFKVKMQLDFSSQFNTPDDGLIVTFFLDKLSDILGASYYNICENTRSFQLSFHFHSNIFENNITSVEHYFFCNLKQLIVK